MHFLQELRLTELSPKQAGFVSSMAAAAETLREVTDDILDHVKQRAGEIVLSLRPESLPTIISRAVAMFSGRATQKSLELRWSVADAVPGCLMFDRIRLTQMLGHLLSNAIKFTPRGSVEVRADVAAVRGSLVTVRVEVRDTGIGLSALQQGRLFAPFEQGDESITRRFGGMGIGLALLKGLAELMGGTAGCASAGHGAGSTFWFTVQTQAAEAQREVSGPLPCLCVGGRVGEGILGAADAQTAHPATSGTAPAHQPLGSVNAETTPAEAPAAATDRTQRPDATCEGKSG